MLAYYKGNLQLAPPGQRTQETEEGEAAKTTLWTGAFNAIVFVVEDVIMSTAIAKNLEEAIERLRRDPVHPVEAVVGDLRVEVRVKAPRSAADLFREVGPWEGETTEALWKRLAEERRLGGSGEPPAL